MRSARVQRMLGVAGLCALLFLLVLGRAVDLSVLRGPAFAHLATLQHRQKIALVPHRGPIVDRNGEPLALSVDVQSIYVRPRQFAGQEAKLAALAAALRLPARLVRAKLGTGQPFVWLERQALPREVEAVEKLALRGVYSVAEGRRFYPHGNLAAHILGFVGIDSQGLEGLERRYDQLIRGEPHYLEVDRDAHGREMFTGGVQAPPAQGARVELTIDAAVQEVTERELAAGVAAQKAAGGAAIVLDPGTGEVLALANVPTYNPNEPGDTTDKRWRNRVRDRAITDPYEPGSTFKAILAAAALEERAVSPAEMFNCEMGHFQIGRWTIHDAHPHGWLSFAEVIQFSSNIGASKVGERLGKDRYYGYLRAFGFGQRTGIELPGETPGIMRPVETWAHIDLATHSFGQGVSVTPVQMAAAFGAIANGGSLMRPFLVRRVLTPQGDVALENEPTVVRRVIGAKASATTTELLRRVVEEQGGTGSKARMDDFSVAGKTGTAQKVDPHTGAYSTKKIGSFVGFVPADKPRLVILVLIDEPSAGSSYGGVVAAPIFKAIALSALKRLGVEPTAPPVTQMADARPPAGTVPSVPPVPVASPARAVAPDPAAGPVAPIPGAVPDLRGLSLREVLTRAHEAGWNVRVQGTGWVASQEPGPGALLAADRRVALTLTADRTTASP